MTRKILVADDSTVIRSMLKADLGAQGFEVDTAPGGRAALEKARAMQFDMIVTDQNMPGMTGIQLVKALRLLPEYQKTPIVVLTTESSDEIKAAFRAAGANGWMNKPYSTERMMAAVAKLLPND